MTKPVAWRGKRAFDLVVASVLTFLTTPLWVLLAGWIRVDAGRPVLFVQERVGVDGRTFRMLKFRTMVNDAVAVGRAQQITDDPYGVVADDPRVTRSGRILRRTGLDELPQLVNVLRGEMSLVGPRPDIPDQVAHYSASDRARLRARPGITGYAQVTGRDRIDWPERIALDREYVSRMSARLDLWILWRTVAELFRDEPEPVSDDWNIAKRREASQAGEVGSSE